MFADDCDTVLKLLIDRGPLSLDQIREATQWSMFTANNVLSQLRLSGRTSAEKTRIKGRNVTLYKIKEQS